MHGTVEAPARDLRRYVTKNEEPDTGQKNGGDRRIKIEIKIEIKIRGGG